MDDIYDPPECPACPSVEHVVLGQLGFKLWLRCRACGTEHHVQEEALDHV